MIQLSITYTEQSLLKLALESHIERLVNMGLEVQADEYSHLLNKIVSAYSSPRIEDTVGYNFFSWAEEYFTEESRRLDCYLPLGYLIQEYNMGIGSGTISSQIFLNKMVDYCAYKGWEINPKQIQNSHGRVIKCCKALVFDHDKRIWISGNKKKAQSMLYIQTPGNSLIDGIYNPTIVNHDDF